MSSRDLAYKVLMKIYKQKVFPSVVLKDVVTNAVDQRFITSLVYTTLQNDRYIAYQYEDLLRNKPAIELDVLLKMSVAQLFFMNKVPDYAVLNESVNLAKKLHNPKAPGFVNALLNQLVARGMRICEGDDIESASVRYSMPLWMMKLFEKQYSLEFACDYARQCLDNAPVYIRFNPRFQPYHERMDMSLFKEDEGVYRADSLIFQTDYLLKGYLLVQDKASQSVVAAMDLKKGDRVLDCCCAPGTKTVQISDRLENSGEIIAVELVESRARLVEQLASLWQVDNIKVTVHDIISFASEEMFDSILIDAPCSGLGVLRHKADIKWNITPEHLDELQSIQASILDHVSQYLKVNRTLVYSTCTLNKKENQNQISAFLDTHENYRLVEQQVINPVEHNCDGFFIAKLQRIW